MAGPDAHPDPGRRWLAPVASGVAYLVLALAAGVATAFVAAAPEVIVEAVAGLALLGVLGGALAGAVSDARPPRGGGDHARGRRVRDHRREHRRALLGPCRRLAVRGARPACRHARRRRRTARRRRRRWRAPRGRACPRARSPSCNGCPEPSISARRSESMVSCGKPARVSAISSARSTCAPSSTISVARPIASASSASTSRPVRTRSSARPSPMIRGSRCVPPSISGTPQRRSRQPNFADRRDDPQVAPQRELEAAGDRVAAAPRRSSAWGRCSPGEAERAAARVGLERLDRLQVGPGAEGLVARPGDDQHARVLVLAERVEVLEQLGGRRAVDRVAPFRPVDA